MCQFEYTVTNSDLVNKKLLSLTIARSASGSLNNLGSWINLANNETGVLLQPSVNVISTSLAIHVIDSKLSTISETANFYFIVNTDASYPYYCVRASTNNTTNFTLNNILFTALKI